MQAKAKPDGGGLEAVWQELERLQGRIDAGGGWSIADFRAYRKLASLTERQLRAVVLVMAGATNGEIGELLGGGENAAKQTVRLAYQKLEIGKRVEAAGLDGLMARIDEEHWMDMAGFEKRWAERALAELRGRRR